MTCAKNSLTINIESLQEFKLSYSDDDDLFEDNDVVVIEETNVNDVDKKTDDFSDLGIEHEAWFKEIRKTLEDTDAFSFSIYAGLNNQIISLLTNLNKEMKESIHSSMVATESMIRNEMTDYDTCLGLKELERAIMASGYYMRHLESMVSALSDDPRSKEPNTLIEYLFLNLGHEYNTITLYVSTLIDQYISYCEKINVTPDSVLVEHQVKNFLTILERQLYGLTIFSPTIEGIGEVKGFEDFRNQKIEVITRTIISMIEKINETIEAIRSGDTSVLSEASTS